MPATGMPSSTANPGERDTRARVARLILEHGPITASDLGERLSLTPAAIRRHLEALLAEGMIEIRRARPQTHRGRGRPAKLFAITDAGRNTFVHAYDDLATSALRFLAETAGKAAVAEFARRQIAELERRHGPKVRAAPQDERVREAFGRLLGTPVQRLATIAHGDGVCTTHVSPSALGHEDTDIEESGRTSL